MPVKIEWARLNTKLGRRVEAMDFLLICLLRVISNTGEINLTEHFYIDIYAEQITTQKVRTVDEWQEKFNSASENE